MQIETFRKVSQFLSISFKMIATFALVFLFIILFNEDSSFTLDTGQYLSFFWTNSYVTPKDFISASSFIAPVILAFLSYILFHSSFLFDRLVEGESPFTFEFVESLREISILLMISDVVVPLVYTVAINVISDQGRYFHFSLSYIFTIGLILYLVSAILNYGINLEELKKNS